MPLVSIIVVNYNGKRHLETCINSLQNIAYPRYEILLVDNASNDDSVDFVRNNFPQVKIIKNKANLGYAEANNIGAKESKGKYLVFLNNDIKAEPNFLNELITEMEKDSSIGMCQGKVFLMDNPKNLDSIGTYFTSAGFLRHIGLKEEDRGQYDQKREIFSPKGVCIVINRNLFEKIEGFDNDFFVYFEESDLAWKVWLAGYRVLYIPQSVIYHKVAATSLTFPFFFIQYHSYKNRMCSLVKNLEFKNLLLFLPFHFLLCFGLILVSLCCLEYKQANTILKAIGWNIRHLKLTLRKRRFVQSRIRKVRDRAIFSRVKAKIPFTQFVKLTKWFIKEY